MICFSESEKEQLLHILQNEVDRGFVPGVNAIVYKDGKELFYGQAGVCSYETKQPMERDTIVRLFSMTKPITATAVMQLVEKGSLSIDDKLSDYIPEFEKSRLKRIDAEGQLQSVENDITIWHLLHMTSGIPYPDEWHEPGRQMGALFDKLGNMRDRGERVDTQEYCRQIAKIPLCFEPGKEWLYGLSADILGAIIEKVTGQTYDAYLQEHIFLPLDMRDTGFTVIGDRCKRFADAYDWDENGNRRKYNRCHLGVYYGENAVFFSGGAGLTSTIDDYAHFTQMLSGKGCYQGKRILSEESIRIMSEDGLSVEQKKNYNWDSLKGYGYGCLMRTLMNPKEAMTKAPVGEFGWDGWMGCYMQADPVNNLSIVYMIQRCGAGTSQGAMSFRNLVYSFLS